MKINNYKVAVVQAGSEVMDKEKGIKKTIRLIEEAAMNHAKIIVFPEAFIPAYPRGMSFGAVVGSRSDEGRKDFARYWTNSITVPGPETEHIGKVVNKAGVYVVIGVPKQFNLNYLKLITF
ncbi:nitrilase-related carbon-nitrogen hydrolase [Lentibacillus daqui]|uniref:nitrilase-related carbon-nitrogen hydrolase n=1 Tax=Lentibacillus daqui TaxID=2911514 RepID=UPI0022B203AB|nr:nitrilase-related carbon-nitrogen hydrolase [Lentibacillus daqui]